MSKARNRRRADSARLLHRIDVSNSLSEVSSADTLGSSDVRKPHGDAYNTMVVGKFQEPKQTQTQTA